jgi:hypothetical protein
MNQMLPTVGSTGSLTTAAIHLNTTTFAPLPDPSSMLQRARAYDSGEIYRTYGYPK